jgi:hypothetical protein
MVSKDVTIWKQNPYQGNIGRELLSRIWRQAYISREGIVNLTKKLGETVKIVGTISDQLTKASGGSCVNDDP